MKDILKQHRVHNSMSFREVLNQPLPFKIPVASNDANTYPQIFDCGRVAEYGSSLDVFLQHKLLSMTSEQAVVILDGMWLSPLQTLSGALIYFDENDPSSQPKLRPDFAVVHNNMLMMKGEAKAQYGDMVRNQNDLINKLHPTAHKMFPNGCTEIPAVTTCNVVIHLFGISYFNQRYILNPVKQYDVSNLPGRVSFIEDLFKLMIWIISQTEPVEGIHLVPGIRQKTPNGHHVTFNNNGILKEFKHQSLDRINMDVIRQVYQLHLPNVEWGTVNCTSITITRVGYRLKDAIRTRNLTKTFVFEQTKLAVNQLHANGFAHCDICVENIFVDMEDGNVFLGDVEFCCDMNSPAPTDLRRSDGRAVTAQDLDLIQLEKLKDELAIL